MDVLYFGIWASDLHVRILEHGDFIAKQKQSSCDLVQFRKTSSLTSATQVSSPFVHLWFAVHSSR